MTFRWPIGWQVLTSAIAIGVSALALYGATVGVPFVHRLAAAEIQHVRGYTFFALAQEPQLAPIFQRKVDTLQQPNASRALLFEDGIPLPGKHAPHTSIHERGRGAFSDWHGSIYFSASDNSDPRINGRIYELRDRSLLNVKLFSWICGIAGLWILTLWGQYSVARMIASASSRGMRLRDVLRDTEAVRTVRHATAFFAGALSSGVASLFLQGMSFWMVFFAGMVFGLLALRQLFILIGRLRGQSMEVNWTRKLALAVATVCFWVVVFEGYLEWLESTAVGGPAPRAATSSGNLAITLPPELFAEIERRRQLLTRPAEWEWKQIEIPGAKWAYTWHGVSHIHDDNDFRRLIGPFPDKRANTMRVMVVGDSMTYGAGIRDEWTYTAQLERAMRKTHRIEFINLGRNGAQSEDIARVIECMVPILKPDLVIYGVSYNDFLPSGVGQYQAEHPFPLPEWLKNHLRERTRFARFVTDGYQSALLLLGLSMDFYDDILKDFDGYQKRFASDVKHMNDFVKSHGLPSIIGIPLDQDVIVGGRGHRISQVAEKLMREAGFDVISLEGYYQRFNGRRFIVSRWEGHPDEEAYAIFAAMLYDHLRQRADVQRFVITARRGN